MNLDTNTPQTSRQGLRFRASQLLACKITNTRDEGLGKVQDIVLTSDNRSIAYVVVGFGGFLGMGEKYFAIPWRMIDVTRNTVDTEPRINLSVDQEVMKAAPGFDKDKWPDMADGTWNRQVDDFYSNRGGTLGAARTTEKAQAPYAGSSLSGSFTGTPVGRNPDSESFSHRRISQILGMTVVDAKRDTLAKVDDLVLDAGRAQIEGAALGFGGVLGVGKHIALVPMESLTLERGRGTFSMQCNAAELEAQALPGGEWPGLDSDAWLVRARQHCDRTKARTGQGAASSWQA